MSRLFGSSSNDLPQSLRCPALGSSARRVEEGQVPPVKSSTKSVTRRRVPGKTLVTQVISPVINSSPGREQCRSNDRPRLRSSVKFVNGGFRQCIIGTSTSPSPARHTEQFDGLFWTKSVNLLPDSNVF